MSDKTKTTKKKVNKQVAIGWVAIAIITVQAIFGAGLWFGTQATLNSQAHEEQVKTQAVEAYKAELSKTEQ